MTSTRRLLMPATLKAYDVEAGEAADDHTGRQDHTDEHRHHGGRTSTVPVYPTTGTPR